MHKYNDFPVSFVGETGRFYVLRNEGLANPAIPPKYAVYASTDTYNARSETPEYTLSSEALSDFAQELKIYAENLKTTPPDARPEDKDETDLGLTPARNFWKQRLNQARHAA